MVKTFIVTASTIIGGFVGWYLGGFDGFLYALIAFVIGLSAYFGITAPGFFAIDNALVILSSAAVIGIVRLARGKKE